MVEQDIKRGYTPPLSQPPVLQVDRYQREVRESMLNDKRNGPREYK